MTGLIWEVKTPTAMIKLYPITSSNLSAETAATYVSKANTDGLCGFHTGWRLPTRRELLSIVHHEPINQRIGPAIDTNYFPNTKNTGYWSSDNYAPSSAEAWYVEFNTGFSYHKPKGLGLSVLLVRNG